ncbi:MAG: 50S ribosomal protein L35 [Chloroflexi bacterium]|nr:50S ribosomal protein L35 [Chloroflexota bacterium]
MGKKYKLKTHKSTAKRFKVTGSGKIMRTKGPKSHLRRNKAKRARRSFDRMQEVTNPAAKRRIKKLAPYLSKYSTKASTPGSRGKGKR